MKMKMNPLAILIGATIAMMAAITTAVGVPVALIQDAQATALHEANCDKAIDCQCNCHLRK